MSDSTHDLPDTPWWSQPGTTAVLPAPLEAPPAPPEPAKPAPAGEGPRKRTSAILLALALVVGGAAGGGVATLVEGNGGTTIGGTTLVSGAVSGGKSSAVAGTPEAAAAIISPSVVTIEVTGQVTNQSFFGQQSTAESDTGSGIIIRSSGYILTNNHVVAAAASGGSVHVTLANGSTVAATIVGTDISTDLAVIKIDGQSGLKAATFAASDDLKVGQAVLAIGAPLGLSNTVTQGIVSTLHRPVRTGDSTSDSAVNDAIQTDAAINPGNSGGALVNLAGNVVGVNSSIASLGTDTTSGSQSGNIGVGFAIPSETAASVASQLIATGKAVHAQIGVRAGDAASSTTGAPGLGATISAIDSGSPAASAGLQVGDIVTKVGNRLVTDSDSLIVAIRTHNPGDKVTLTVERGGATKTITVTLGTSSS